MSWWKNALRAAAAELDARCEKLFSRQQPLEAFINSYLSQWQRASPDQG